MKIYAFLWLSIVTVGLVVAFPHSSTAVDNVSVSGLVDAASSSTTELRRPRHLLKHLLGLDRPIVVQPQPVYVNHPANIPPNINMNVYQSSGRGNGGGYYGW